MGLLILKSVPKVALCWRFIASIAGVLMLVFFSGGSGLTQSLPPAGDAEANAWQALVDRWYPNGTQSPAARQQQEPQRSPEPAQPAATQPEQGQNQTPQNRPAQSGVEPDKSASDQSQTAAVEDAPSNEAAQTDGQPEGSEGDRQAATNTSAPLPEPTLELPRIANSLTADTSRADRFRITSGQLDAIFDYSLTDGPFFPGLRYRSGDIVNDKWDIDYGFTFEGAISAPRVALLPFDDYRFRPDITVWRRLGDNIRARLRSNASFTLDSSDVFAGLGLVYERGDTIAILEAFGDRVDLLNPFVAVDDPAGRYTSVQQGARFEGAYIYDHWLNFQLSTTAGGSLVARDGGALQAEASANITLSQKRAPDLHQVFAKARNAYVHQALPVSYSGDDEEPPSAQELIDFVDQQRQLDLPTRYHGDSLRNFLRALSWRDFAVRRALSISLDKDAEDRLDLEADLRLPVILSPLMVAEARLIYQSQLLPDSLLEDAAAGDASLNRYSDRLELQAQAAWQASKRLTFAGNALAQLNDDMVLEAWLANAEASYHFDSDLAASFIYDIQQLGLADDSPETRQRASALLRYRNDRFGTVFASLGRDFDENFVPGAYVAEAGLETARPILGHPGRDASLRIGLNYRYDPSDPQHDIGGYVGAVIPLD